MKPLVVSSFRGDNFFLSNYYISLFRIEYGDLVVTVPSGEHAFQAWKAKTEDDWAKIIAAGTPNKAKFLGRKITLRPDWDDVKDECMEAVIKAKFSEGSGLADKLLATGDRLLIEGNTWGDRYWGAVWDKDLGIWKGKNKLGEILMERRAILNG